ncbi:feruloyl-CoA synthase [Curvibacter sp. CHRR-16]|uniref:feruloyl-CoA synthase n=1 Tax=Curvibacter sp. CHRR-16 TaxID=2835872 RepID=UPI001BDA70A1|nr:feruloyl-CoA synthase [Curvibacter sp. CHRR-16]MBT0568856.1 feruloyl-CoA synthase [Curvibacter sp. CHRR-16]
MTTTTSHPYRSLRFGVTRGIRTEGADGVQYLRAETSLQPYAERMTDRLLHWAATTPNRTWMAQRVHLADGSKGDWRTISYAQALASARAIAQNLLQRNLSAERPVLILSENDLDHALLTLGCMLAGVPWSPASPAYSTISTDYSKLRHVVNTLTPGLVFAADPDRYGKAIQATIGNDVDVVLSNGSLEGRASTPFAQLLATTATDAVDRAIAATGPDTIVKFLFTSGSTKLPKAVINTQRMWCANQQQMRQSMPVLTETAPVLVDWLPWNHTFGGNHNFGMVLYNGGTLYIDEGKPVPALIGETLRNLREVAPTLYFNVPTGFEAIAAAMKTDPFLRKNFLSRVTMFFYAGASLAQPVWDSLFESAQAEIGERIVMASGLGMTESSPFGLFVTSPDVVSGDLGLPTPGLELKLVPTDGKLEVRYRGPNITPGYWRAPQETAAHFDAEGFFCTGDALKWADPDNIHQGLRFDGRIAEDFKLATGTFVSVGPLRAKIIAAGAPCIQDVVITGLNQHEVGAMVFPNLAACRKTAGQDASATPEEVLTHPAVLAHFQQLVNTLAASATGSANRIARLCLLAEPPTIDRGEITDKGSINQRAVLAHRAATVQALHDGSLPHTLTPQ